MVLLKINKKASTPISLLIIYYLWRRSYFYLPYSLENKQVYSRGEQKNQKTN